ncbi:hypothetical protein G4Z16_06490 [Streptomyces bathyalis]|uniref:Uncharacterized protein n=1 Tax=Streptomyces bathyalis TaxID=2710756 RepID=A0A7T1WR58_9ACTN|nr:hypothetical protein [Streptomyces bathyalis]QPP06101.1 hypothetical protein G4Z16_06490 [Streptomyces bathyalis]
MKTLRRVLVPGVMALTLGGLVAPSASAAGSSHEVAAHSAGILRTWHATVQCQIVRISDNNVVGYDRADGSGNSKENAIKAAKANVPVPQGHYKRHCDAKRVW